MGLQASLIDLHPATCLPFIPIPPPTSLAFMPSCLTSARVRSTSCLPHAATTLASSPPLEDSRDSSVDNTAACSPAPLVSHHRQLATRRGAHKLTVECKALTVDPSCVNAALALSMAARNSCASAVTSPTRGSLSVLPRMAERASRNTALPGPPTWHHSAK